MPGRHRLDFQDGLPLAKLIRGSLALASIGVLLGQAKAQETALSFTIAQAEAGAALYASACVACHGANLDDGPLGSSLKGPQFMQKYGGKSAVVLFDVTQTTMPQQSPGSLAPADYANLVAFMLRENSIVPGESPLPSGPAALASMMVPAGGFSFMAFSPYTANPAVDLPSPLDDFRPVTDAAIIDPPAGDWLTWRRSYDAHGFSPLDEIDAGNVEDLRLVWSWTMPAGSNENVPLVRDGTMFVYGYGDIVQALDAATGDLLWEYRHRLESGASPFHKRALALHGERIFIGTSDTHVVALDVQTGEPVWDTRVADFSQNETMNGGPLVAEGMVMIGTTATGVGGKRGGPQIVGLDAATGEIRWRVGTIPKPGEPGGDSWNGLAWDERTGASVWTAGSYDPLTGLAYFGTGNTYDTGPLLVPDDDPATTNDALYTNATLAIEPATGELVWAFQHFPNDQWDLDWAFERQIVDLEIGGRERRVSLTAGKIGIYEGVDAGTGEFLFAIDLGLQNIVAEIDTRTGAKTINRDVLPGAGRVALVCPHGAGAKNFQPASFDQQSGVLYVPLNEACMDVFPVPGGGRGALSSGVNWGIRPRPDSDGLFGRLQAIDLATGENVWVARQRAPQTAGVLATAGGLVFAASLDRAFRAHDAKNGDLLWETRLNDVSSSSPISYSVNGRQFVAIPVGQGGFHAGSFVPLVPELQSPPNRGAAIWVFALPD
ncbi:MAG TPA: PQQ-binding-like beta-propeller repeat protein [Gammaproteobacteria bacterium]|nr:PQQ-binding-like beta-propeller repeat protein [Gammaproteobacteria bacterium]